MGNAVVMNVGGRLDEASCRAFEEAWTHALTNGAVHLIADLSTLTYISSAGIGSFARAARQVHQRRGEIALTGLHGLVKDVFELTQIVTIFRVFESPELALASLP